MVKFVRNLCKSNNNETAQIMYNNSNSKKALLKKIRKRDEKLQIKMAAHPKTILEYYISIAESNPEILQNIF